MISEKNELNFRELELFLQQQRLSMVENLTATERIDHAEAELAMTLVYRILNLPAPEFRWVSHPWFLTKGTAEKVFRGKAVSLSQAEEKVGHRVRMVLEENLSSDDFNEFFQTMWNILPARQVRSLATHVENELRARRAEVNLLWQTNTIHQFSFGPREEVLRETSWSLDIEWAVQSFVRLAIAEAARGYFKVKIDDTNNYQLDCFLALARAAHAYLCYEQICVMSERPLEIYADAESRLHKEAGPAIRYGDGLEIYSWHGTRVPEVGILQEPTVNNIEYELNVELRRVFIERYGVERYLLDSGSEIRQHDECGTLYVKEVLNDEDIVMVRVTNSTPEIDGESRNYFLRVPPTIRTAREAVAWTFGMTVDEYKPSAES
jgi:hypothetical protein